MFTGIIEDIGVLSGIRKLGGRWELSVRTNLPGSSIREGDSISVDGVCLTATKISANVFTLDASLETLRLTTLKEKRPGLHVNLERAMSADGRFGGHIVTGHVDGTGIIIERAKEGDSERFVIEVSPEISDTIVRKGSVTIDGISLTVNDRHDNTFTVNIIPYTVSRTTIGEKNLRDVVNIETDIIGKYVGHFLRKQNGKGIDKEFLSRYGFIQGE
ncbi:MAG TPA: riboflavin synthase [Syntrophorhabdaceae bacterium]|nr:riboflavin synthase [Syntrophorhabdaceae bacterium]